MILVDKMKTINCCILELNDVVTKILLFGDNTPSASSNTLILNTTIDYIISTKSFYDTILSRG